MKILIVNHSDIQGGAARAAYRLHKSLQSIGVSSKMLVQAKSSDDHTVLGPVTGAQKIMAKLRPKLDEMPMKLYRNRDSRIFSTATIPFSNIVGKINNSDADVVHLHWICGGMLRIEDLARIKKPIIWTLHDMWPFTGGCHLNQGCLKYTKACGACPALGSSQEKDLSFRIFKRKTDIYQRMSNLTIVGLSKWLANCARESKLFETKRIVDLPNPIDTNIYKPLNKGIARDLLGLSRDGKLVLFGAIRPTKDRNKGYHELLKALEGMSTADTELIVFGSSKPPSGPDYKFPTHYLGLIHDDLSLRIVYSAADVVVVPSLQENLSNVIMESLACGTPVVAFDIGGNGDMVDHKVNGFLAKPFDSAELANGVEWVLNHSSPEILSNSARGKVVRQYDAEVVANEYLSLYNGIIKIHKNA